jgi:hypothetical protein
MPPHVELTEATFARIKSLADPFKDTTPEAVIQKALDAYEQKSSGQNGNSNPTKSGAQPRSFDAISPPDLTHTKLLSAKLDGAHIREVKWNQLLVEAIRLARKHASTDDELRRLIPVNFVTGKKDTDGYHFYPDIGLSVQGQEAKTAWQASHHIARQLGISIEAEFQWRVKDGAAHPGVTGRLSA